MEPTSLEKPFAAELWEDLRPFLLHFISDSIKTACILGALLAFWEGVNLLRIRGYPDEYLKGLESTHFVFMWCTLCVTGGNFVLKQVFALWRKK